MHSGFRQKEAFQGTSSPPSSIPRRASRRAELRVVVGLAIGGTIVSKLSFRLAEDAINGVLAIAGVFGQFACAGLGVTLQKSEKLKLVGGVWG